MVISVKTLHKLTVNDVEEHQCIITSNKILMLNDIKEKYLWYYISIIMIATNKNDGI